MLLHIRSQSVKKSKKQYSIWTCPRADVHFKNTANKVLLCSENLVGNATFDENFYDLINFVFVCLGNNNEENRLLKLLNAIFTSGLPANAILNLLRDDYEIIADNDMKGAVTSMCDLRQGYIDIGKEEGRKEGKAETISGIQETAQKIKQFMSEHPKCTLAEAVERFAQTEDMAKTLMLIHSL